MFVQNLQISRHFISYLEGTNMVVNYPEHLLLPKDDELDSQSREEDIEVTHDAMDNLFGNSGSDEILSCDDNESDNGVKGCPDDLGVPYDNKSQREPDKRNGDSLNYTADWDQYGCGDDQSLSNYLALTPQDFPQTLRSLQLPKMRRIGRLTPPSSLTTTFLHLHPVRILFLTALVSLWVEMLDEETDREPMGGQHNQWSIPMALNVPSFVDTHTTDHRAWRYIPVVPVNGVEVLILLNKFIFVLVNN
ncbi:hypothetical protein PQX77_018533 [Marasmius sp. AFHP31]|nr:hypothetical protein PQX77_018533 [Marasmius sp. AFHP31]